ncbi:ABC transporter ATP-binding protein [candidate division KSB1 bacterium]|nr:ABC transporter ATP-binding protein [candidate division KSB1 bacterium]NIR70024.1 ABC transporter ATP-binding protein [candidate division KSB1 bacterium]NIS23922.1 ABC transporter ATP-binding protein [candidate division KSB1 bacterium]NIT70839.1 ABC transporter ATP-binding protein [candidate division KSB1 bacterium]NIU24570.1 ABC transporter ATP-binding protein [candidate division KSB1 bacterium]
MNPIVEAEKLCKSYSLGKVDIPALTNINLTIEYGEFMAISGPSGSGKTTLLNLIGLIDQPTTGRLRLQGQPVGQNGLAKLHEVRLSKIGFIFQTFNLVPVLTAFENVEYPLLLTDMPSAEREHRVHEVLDLVGLTEVSQHKPRELSGGQRQRAAIARALVNRPKLILADEPTANLDSQTGQVILKLMARLNREKGVTFIFSTHDPHIVGMANRVIQIRDGRIVH